MGFKASMIIIHRPSRILAEEELLQQLDLGGLTFRETTTMEDCIYPGDRSVNIGYFNDNIVICEDYLLSTVLEATEDPVSLAPYEQVLSSMFPDSEILTVACHSSVNYHLYSLVKNGIRLRFKRVIASGPILEHGQRLREEEEIYGTSRVFEGKRYFDKVMEGELAHGLTEDQLMEDFAFGVAKRHLGVKISSGEENVLMFDTPFSKFVQAPPQVAVRAKPARPWWKFWGSGENSAEGREKMEMAGAMR